MNMSRLNSTLACATEPRPRHRVAIVGGGFGGLFAAKALRRADVDVTLIDRTNHHLFQPLLYQLATGILSEGDIAPPSARSSAAREREGPRWAKSWPSTSRRRLTVTRSIAAPRSPTTA